MSDTIFTVDSASFQDFEVSASLRAGPSITVDFTQATIVSGSFSGPGGKLTGVSASYIIPAANATASNAVTASTALTANAISFVPSAAVSASWVSASVHINNADTASYFVTSSVTNAISSSVATTASYTVNAATASAVYGGYISGTFITTVDPTTAQQVATKNYVDNINPQAMNYYFRSSSADVAGYENMYRIGQAPMSASALTLSISSVSASQYLFSFISPAVNTTRISLANINYHYHAYRTGGGPNSGLVAELYLRTAGGVENKVADNIIPTLLTTTTTDSFSDSMLATSSIYPSITDRFVLKFKASPATSGNPTITFTVDDDSGARLEVPLPASAYVMSGGDKMSGPLTNSYGFYGTSSFSVSSSRSVTSETASYITFVPNTATTATQSINAFSASWVSASNLITSASHADTASFAFLVNSASYAATCSVFIYSNITQSLTNIATQSLYSTQSSYATQSISSSYANTSSWAINIPTVVSCSWASSSYSASFVTASNVMGAVGIAQTAYVANAINFVPNSATNSTQSIYATQSINAFSASWVSASAFITTAQTASYVTASNVTGKVSSALTADTASSINFVPSAATSASWVSASAFITTAQTASYIAAANLPAYTASWANTAQSANFATQSSFSTQSAFASQSINAFSASWISASAFITTAQTASYVTSSNVTGKVFSALTADTASSINFVPSAAVSSSWVSASAFITTAQTASYITVANLPAHTASWANTAQSANFSTQSLFASQSINAYSSSWVSASAFITTAQTASYVTASNIVGAVATAINILTTGSLTNAQFYISFVTNESGSNVLYTDSSEGLMYNPGPDTLVTTNIALTGSMTASVISASMEMMAPPPQNYYDVATKGYVDSIVSFAKEYYFRTGSSGIVGSNAYYTAFDIGTPLSASDSIVSIAAVSSSQYILGFITPALGVTNIPAGNINVHYHAYFNTGGPRLLTVATELYIRSASVETEVSKDSGVVIAGGTGDSYDAILILTSSLATRTTDKMIVKFKAITAAGNPTATFTVDGDTSAGIGIPLESANFVLKSGDIMTGNLTVPAMTASNGLVIGPSTDSSASFYISGSPFSNIMEVDRNDGAEVFIISPSGSTYIASGSITGSVFGTASYAYSSSIAVSASYAPGSPSISASYAATASVLLGSITSASYALSASYAPASPSVSSSYASTSSLTSTASLATTASYANHVTMTSSINFNLNSTVPITLGDKGNYILGNNMTLTGWQILCNPAASIAIEVQWSNYSNYPTFTSLTNGNFVSVSASYKNQSTITNWTSSLALGDILKFIVTSSNSTATSANLILQGTKYV